MLLSATAVAIASSLLHRKFLAEHPSLASFWQCFLLVLVAQLPVIAAFNTFIYPLWFSPFRKLPQAPQSRSWRQLLYEPTGDDCLCWMQTVENDGLIRYRGLLNSERILICSTEGMLEVLQTNPYDFVKSPGIRRLLVVLLGEGLVVAEGNKHKLQRKNLTPAFSFRKTKDLYPVFWDKASEYCSALDQQVRESSESNVDCSAVVDLVGWHSRVTMDIICVAGLGDDPKVIQNPNADWFLKYRLGFIPSKEARQAKLLALLLPAALLRWLPLKRVQDVQEAQRAVKAHLRGILATKREAFNRGEGEPQSDMISLALASGAFTNEELLDQSMTLLAAGHETTGGSLSWAAYVLSQKPKAQAHLREEIRRKLPSPSKTTTMSAEVLDDLPYLRAVCNEVLRLYCPIPMLHRSAVVDTTVLGTHIPKGTNLRISPWAVSQSREHWGSSAVEFIPERWLQGEGSSNGGAENHYSFMAFSQGARNCIGSSFARAEFAACLACLVGRFDIKLEMEGKVEVEHSITARINGGLRVRLTPLDGW